MRILDHAWEEEVTLSVTLRNFLGHITGPNFHSLYRLFGDHCRQIDRWLGEITDRTRAFGAVSRASGPGASAQVSPASHATLPTRNMVDELLALHEGIATRLRDDLAACRSEATIADLIARLVEFHETTAWMLRTVLDAPEVPGRSG